jgi:hypothetical protein
MKEIIINIWSWFTVIFLIIDFFLIAFLFTTILLFLLSPLVILIGVPILIENIWGKNIKLNKNNR